MKKHTYTLGYVDYENGGILEFNKQHYSLPDDAMCRVLELMCNKLDVSYKQLKTIDFISPHIKPFSVVSGDITYNITCPKNYIEDFQIFVMKEELSKGYIYNSKKERKAYNFFLKQLPQEITEDKEKDGFVDACVEMGMIDEIKNKIKSNSVVLKKTERNQKVIFESDFKRELVLAISGKQKIKQN